MKRLTHIAVVTTVTASLFSSFFGGLGGKAGKDAWRAIKESFDSSSTSNVYAYGPESSVQPDSFNPNPISYDYSYPTK